MESRDIKWDEGLRKTEIDGRKFGRRKHINSDGLTITSLTLEGVERHKDYVSK